MFCFSFSSSKANSKIKIRKKKQVIFIFGNIVICIFYFLFSFWFPRLNQSFHSFISLPSPPPAYYMPLKINKQFPQNKKKTFGRYKSRKNGQRWKKHLGIRRGSQSVQLCGWLGMRTALRLRTAAILEEGGGGEK